MLELYYLGNNRFGGWVTYTVQLLTALRAAKVPCQLLRVADREGPLRPFACGETYRNVTLAQATQDTGPKLILGLGSRCWEATERLLTCGAYLVLHDPTELKFAEWYPVDRTIVIRKANRKLGRWVVRHPYLRIGGARTVKYHAACLSRISTCKRIPIMLDANRLLGMRKRIRFFGFSDRMYVHYNLKPKYPEWQEVKPFGHEPGAAVRLLEQARFAVDMSLLPGDGGGTQYTHLEAWDAGAILIVNRDWIRPNDDLKPGRNCLAVDGAQGLAEVLRKGDGFDDIRQGGVDQLAAHDPRKIGLKYKRILEV